MIKRPVIRFQSLIGNCDEETPPLSTSFLNNAVVDVILGAKITGSALGAGFDGCFGEFVEDVFGELFGTATAGGLRGEVVVFVEEALGIWGFTVLVVGFEPLDVTLVEGFRGGEAATLFCAAAENIRMHFCRISFVLAFKKTVSPSIVTIINGKVRPSAA